MKRVRMTVLMCWCMLLVFLLAFAGCSKGSEPLSTAPVGENGEREYSPMLRQLQSWIPVDYGIYTTPWNDYNVDTSNVVFGKSYSLNPTLPGRNMFVDNYVDNTCTVSINVIDDGPDNGLWITVFWDNDWIARANIGVFGHNPAVTAHLESIEGEDLVIIDVVYQLGGSILHYRYIQDEEGDLLNFSPLYGPILVSGIEENCHHPDVVYDARSWGNEPGYLYCVYEGIGARIRYARMEDEAPFDEDGTWDHESISDIGAIYPRLDVGNVLVTNGEPLMLWSVVVVWMAYGTGFDIIWHWRTVGDDPITCTETLPTAPEFNPYWDCFIPFVDIAPYEYEIWSDNRASINITYTQMQDLNNDDVFDAAALYAAMEPFILGTGPVFHHYYVAIEENWDEGLVQIALDAMGSNTFDGRFVYLRGPIEPLGSPLRVWSAETDWEVWEGDPVDGVYGRAKISDDNQTPPMPYYNDAFTPSIALCLQNTYWAVWTDNREVDPEQETGLNVFANYWTP